MAHPILPLFSDHQYPSPWAFPSSKDSSSKPSASMDPLTNAKSIEKSPLDLRSQSGVHPGSIPISMSGNQYMAKGSFFSEGNRSLSANNSRVAKMPPGALSHVGWNNGSINAPYGIIGSNLSMPALRSMRIENQPSVCTQRQASTPTPRPAVPVLENNSQIPAAPLSAPPFQTSFLPLFPPPGARQGFIMPGDWTLNPGGFLISENARRLNAIALEVDQARMSSVGRKSGPAMGCRMCAMAPQVMLLPCEHSVCSECGSRFMAASGGMYCSCGELVSSMINLNIPRTLDLRPSYYLPLLHHQVHPPPGLSAPGPLANDVSRITSFTPAPKPHKSSIRSITPPHPHTLPYALSISLPLQVATPQTNITLDTPEFTIDAETAIENAPFVELGRHALAQNWCCVKISNIPYSVTGENIMEFLGKNAKVVPEDVGLSIHIIMDRASGKTMDAFVEFTCPKDAYRCVTRKRGKILGSRHVLLDVVKQEELMKELFPKARGVTWEGVIPNVMNNEDGNTKADLVTKEELVLVVGHARTPHRSPFSRKCLQRPYESILSIVAKFPWFAVSVYTLHQRDIIFQALISIIDILKRQCKRGRTTPNLDTELLKRLCKAGVSCAGFTNKQKREIVKVGEFGAEGLEKEVEDEIPGFESLLALSRKRGAEIKLVELFGALGILQRKHQVKPTPLPATADPEKQAAISRLPSALMDELDEPNEPDRNSPTATSPTPVESLTEMEMEAQAKYTMAQMAELEWATIERFVTTALPPRGRARETLVRKPCNTISNNHNRAS